MSFAGTTRQPRIFRGLNTDHRRHSIHRWLTTACQGENRIPCRDAREQSSELEGYVRVLTITGLMDDGELGMQP